MWCTNECAIIGSFNYLERPTLRILEYLPVSDWYGLGLQLDIDANQLDAISHTFKDDFKECKRQMFQIWLCMALNASYGELVKALDKDWRVVCCSFVTRAGQTWQNECSTSQNRVITASLVHVSVMKTDMKYAVWMLAPG